VFAPGARRVTDVKVTLGQDPPGATAPTETTATTTPATTTPAPSAGESPAKEPASKSPDRTKGSPSKDKGKPAKEQPAHDKPTAESPAKEKAAGEEPAKDDPGKEPSSGEPGASAGEVVLTTTSTQQIVQLKVKPEQQQLAKLGETVTVQLPGGGEAPGRVTEVGTVASESSSSGDEPKGSSGESGESTIPVTIALDHDIPHLDEAPVSVELVKSVRRNVLTVPATALIATAGGGYAVEALASSPKGEQNRRVTVPVTPGMFAGGYVQVEGAGVREGMTVIESQ
jgi:hypothetical protein